mmetsp:Transcript_4160/g.10165  ORF Transcript_4160/g.10165 Transcript_4160/m.10165 type:complete len:213 (+) Transcript_4160:345-983(+)
MDTPQAAHSPHLSLVTWQVCICTATRFGRQNRKGYITESISEVVRQMGAGAGWLGCTTYSSASFVTSFGLLLFLPLILLPLFFFGTFSADSGGAAFGLGGCGWSDPRLHTCWFHSNSSTSSCSHRNSRTSSIMAPSVSDMSTVFSSMPYTFSLMPPLRSRLAHLAPSALTSSMLRAPVGSATSRANVSCGPAACFFSSCATSTVPPSPTSIA